MTLVLSPFAGPGGWCSGLRLAGYTGYNLGIERDGAACRTAHAAGHPRVQADVATFPLDHLAGKVAGAILSPPCGPWSGAGDRKGELDRPAVYERIAAFAAGRTPAEVVWHDERSLLTAEPMRWAVALRPRWIALEQVPAVLPLWRYTAELLRAMGYRAWCGLVDSERYGVAQTRRRAILAASLDGPVGPPVPTHESYQYAPEPDGLFGNSLSPMVSAADAIGWDRPGEWVVCTGNNSRQGRGLTLPYHRSIRHPSTGLTANTGSWVIHPDGEACRGDRAFRENAVHITPQQAGLLQSFPADHPWQGTKGEQHRQIADAVPPLLAAAVLRPLLAAHLAEVAA